MANQQIIQRYNRRRDPRNEKNVTMVAKKVSDTEFNIGISVRNPADKQDRNLGVTLAVGRVHAEPFSLVNIPRDVDANDVMDFYRRCQSYFKGCTLQK